MSDIVKKLNWRYATKKFDANKKVSDHDFELIKDALRLTPTSYGLQAFKFIIVESPVLREQLVEASFGQRQVAESSHLIVLCSYDKIDDSDVDTYMKLVAQIRHIPVEKLEGFGNMIKGTTKARTEEEIRVWTAKQTYIALGQMLTTCAHLEIDALPMEGFSPDEYDKILGLSEKDLTATLVCPVGYRHHEDRAQHNKKVRKSKDDLFEIL